MELVSKRRTVRSDVCIVIDIRVCTYTTNTHAYNMYIYIYICVSTPQEYGSTTYLGSYKMMLDVVIQTCKRGGGGAGVRVENLWTSLTQTHTCTLCVYI